MKVYDWYITPEEYRIAEKNGIKRDTLEKRIRYHGWDKERAITEPIKGSKYKKWVQLAKKNGISSSVFYQRVNRLNWSIKKAATTPINSTKHKYPKWIKEELKKNGIKYYTFLKRIENGWDLERAYTERTWSKYDALAKGRGTQKENNIGPYYVIDNIFSIMSANKNKNERRTI